MRRVRTRAAVWRTALALALVLALALAFSACSDEQPATSTTAATGDPPSTTAAQPAPTPVRHDPPRRLTMTFSGDVLIHEPVWERALAFGDGERYAFEPLLAPLRGVIGSADVSVCHLETPLVAGTPSGYPLFATPPELATALADTGWDACSTASNHSVDQGLDGIASTTAALDRAGIEHAGTTANPGAHTTPAIVERRGVRVALLSYTTDTNGLPIEREGSVELADPERIVADARRARSAGADVVVVNVHWGSGEVPEYVSEPNAAQRELADRLLGSGAVTALVAQGPHVVQPVELRDGRAVVYSSGNLVSNQGTDSGLPAASQDGIVVRMRIRVPDRGEARVASARWLPILTTRPDYVVEPVTRRAGSKPRLDPAEAAASYERTAAAVGGDEEVRPLGSPPG